MKNIFVSAMLVCNKDEVLRMYAVKNRDKYNIMVDLMGEDFSRIIYESYGKYDCIETLGKYAKQFVCISFDNKGRE